LGINNIVINPADVPARGSEKLRKADAVDSGKLARELRSKSLTGIYVADEAVLEMRSLIRLRGQIVKDTTREKNRIKSLLRFHGIDLPQEFTKYSVGNWSKRFLKWLGEVVLCTEYGRKTLDLHIDSLVRLREMLLQETRAIRAISMTEPFSETIRLLYLCSGNWYQHSDFING
jgi:transposase